MENCRVHGRLLIANTAQIKILLDHASIALSRLYLLCTVGSLSHMQQKLAPAQSILKRDGGQCASEGNIVLYQRSLSTSVPCASLLRPFTRTGF